LTCLLNTSGTGQL